MQSPGLLWSLFNIIIPLQFSCSIISPVWRIFFSLLWFHYFAQLFNCLVAHSWYTALWVYFVFYKIIRIACLYMVIAKKVCCIVTCMSLSSSCTYKVLPNYHKTLGEKKAYQYYEPCEPSPKPFLSLMKTVLLLVKDHDFHFFHNFLKRKFLRHSSSKNDFFSSTTKMHIWFYLRFLQDVIPAIPLIFPGVEE